jgi:hypothetical protein
VEAHSGAADNLFPSSCHIQSSDDIIDIGDIFFQTIAFQSIDDINSGTRIHEAGCSNLYRLRACY